MVNEYDYVETLVAKGEIPAGTYGLVVSLYADGLACEVEVWDETRYPIDVVTYELDEIKVLQNLPES